MKYFLGIDPSLTDTGIAIINDKNEIVFSDSIKTENQGNYVKNRFERCFVISNGIKEFVVNYKIDVIAIENYSLQGKGKIVQLVELGTFIRQNFFNSLILEVAPLSLKKYILGNVKGSNKSLILKEVFKKWGIDVDNDNIADAFVLAKLARHYYYKNVLKTNDVFHKYQDEVIDSVYNQNFKK